LGLAGGGTDLSPYCDEHGGAVLNVTIDRFAYAFVEPRSTRDVVFRSNDLRLCETHGSLDEVRNSKLDLHRGVYLRLIEEHCGGELLPVTITTSVDVPAGSGLGSSSSLMVALVDAMRTHLDIPLGQYDVAHLAFEIERKDLKLSGGKQDQYASAFGGANFIEFFGNDRVLVNPLRILDRIQNEFESSLVICFSGQSRQSAKIIEEQVSAVRDHAPRAVDAMHRLKADAIEMKSALLLGDIPRVAEILDRSWAAKKETAASISNPHIERLYGVGRNAGAVAGKVSGAGGGGFMMFIVPPENRMAVVEALNREGSAAGAVKFTSQGCETWHSSAWRQRHS
jgi:D-glycero-alpha-D-manno-heptose-7-phosphate kinase